jgi:hypothetical protein
VKINVTTSAKLRDFVNSTGLTIEDAGNAAVVRQTRETLGEMRVQIAQRLTPRAANALREKRYLNPPVPGGQGQVVGFIHSAWFRSSRLTGDDIDIFRSFETGAVIRPVRGDWLTIPLPAAYSVVGRGRKRPTPAAIETALGVKLFRIRSRRGNDILAVTPESGGVALGSRTTRGAKRVTIKPVRYVKTAGGRSFPTSRRATPVAAPIAMFLLLRNSRLPKRLDFGPIRQKYNVELAKKFLVEMGRRER